MNKFYILGFLFIICACSSNIKNDDVIKSRIIELDSLKNHYPEVLRPLTNNDWVKKFDERIKRDNPNFELDPNKDISYFVIPNLMLADSILIKDNIDMESYFAKGMLTLNEADCYVLEDEIPIGTFSINDNKLIPMSPGIFNDYIRKRNICIVKRSKLYFRLCISTKIFVAYMPGVVFVDEMGDFKFLNYNDNKIYGIHEIYCSLFDDKEKFRLYINKFVERGGGKF